MSLPYLHAYNDIKLQKAYELYLGGMSQAAAAKASKVPPRTLQRRCSEDGWTAERQARRAVSPPTVPPMAAGDRSAPPSATQTSDAATVSSGAPVAESRLAGMEAMLREWQGTIALLRVSLTEEIRSVFVDAAANGKRPTRSQIAQYTALATNLAALDKKVWCVPDKIQTEDTTPTPEDRVRKLKDDELERELAREQGTAAAAAARAQPAESVH